MGEVVSLQVGPVGDGFKISAADVLDAAVGHNLHTVVVIGLTKDGELYAAASDGSAETVFPIERAKLMLLQNEVERI